MTLRSKRQRNGLPEKGAVFGPLYSTGSDTPRPSPSSVSVKGSAQSCTPKPGAKVIFDENLPKFALRAIQLRLPVLSTTSSSIDFSSPSHIWKQLPAELITRVLYWKAKSSNKDAIIAACVCRGSSQLMLRVLYNDAKVHFSHLSSFQSTLSSLQNRIAASSDMSPANIPCISSIALDPIP
jgi:hypothetical protein